jgi:Asp/Glu/hydantoin racemase
MLKIVIVPLTAATTEPLMSQAAGIAASHGTEAMQVTERFQSGRRSLEGVQDTPAMHH